MERVIFRAHYNPFVSSTAYLAVFPDVSANVGRFAAVAFHFEDGRAVFEPFDEISHDYYFKKTRLVSKVSSEMPSLLSALKERYGETFRAVDKIMRVRG